MLVTALDQTYEENKANPMWIKADDLLCMSLEDTHWM